MFVKPADVLPGDILMDMSTVVSVWSSIATRNPGMTCRKAFTLFDHVRVEHCSTDAMVEVRRRA